MKQYRDDNTWWGFIKAEAEKERKERTRREKKRHKANTKAFWSPQSFGVADKKNGE